MADASQQARTVPELSSLGLCPGERFWVFGCGSLMWNPGFAYAERRPAMLRGYHSAFCVVSTGYRGTKERPGLVLGLDRGGSCRGVAFRVAEGHEREVMDYLWEREMRTGVYRPGFLPVSFLRADPRQPRPRALCFIVHRDHPQYAGRLSVDEAAHRIAVAAGSRGPCREYLANTVQQLTALGMRRTRLHRINDRVEDLHRVRHDKRHGPKH